MMQNDSTFSELVAIMARLRGPGGCPWDRKQTHATLRPYLLEEAYEALEAIDAEDDAELCKELGDVLLQVVFHAQIAAEEGRFDIEAVGQAIVDKLIRRHPHVFDDASADGARRGFAPLGADQKAGAPGARGSRAFVIGGHPQVPSRPNACPSYPSASRTAGI